MKSFSGQSRSVARPESDAQRLEVLRFDRHDVSFNKFPVLSLLLLLLKVVALLVAV